MRKQFSHWQCDGTRCDAMRCHAMLLCITWYIQIAMAQWTCSASKRTRCAHAFVLLCDRYPILKLGIARYSPPSESISTLLLLLLLSCALGGIHTLNLCLFRTALDIKNCIRCKQSPELLSMSFERKLNYFEFGSGVSTRASKSLGKWNAFRIEFYAR